MRKRESVRERERGERVLIVKQVGFVTGTSKYPLSPHLSFESMSIGHACETANQIFVIRKINGAWEETQALHMYGRGG